MLIFSMQNPVTCARRFESNWQCCNFKSLLLQTITQQSLLFCLLLSKFVGFRVCKMESRNWKQVYRDQNNQMRALFLRKIEIVHQKCEELRNKKRHHDKLLENIANLKSQVKTVDASVLKVIKETKEMQLQNGELKSVLRNENTRTEDLKSEMNNMQKGLKINAFTNMG